MTRPDYIWHVTLQSGHSRRSMRSEIDDGVIDELAPLLESDGERPMPRIAGRRLRITRSGRTLLATVFAGSAPICTIGVAGRSRGAARLWQALHDGAHELATHADDQPAAPWCAARLEVGLVMYPEDATWLGDFERCLAWTWIERFCESTDDD